MFKNVIVGVDGRQGGRGAIALAEQLAASDGRITLARIYGGNAMLRSGAALVLAGGRRKSQELLAFERDQAQSMWN